MTPQRGRRVVPVPFALLLLLSSATPLTAQGLEYVKAHYTKYEHQIPMRDGVRLFTAVYVPCTGSAPRNRQS